MGGLGLIVWNGLGIHTFPVVRAVNAVVPFRGRGHRRDWHIYGRAWDWCSGLVGLAAQGSRRRWLDGQR